VASEHDLYKTMGNICVCIEFELLKVKVPSFFLQSLRYAGARVFRTESDCGTLLERVVGCQNPPQIEVDGKRRYTHDSGMQM
jgi:hypothetical protein